MPDTKLIKIDPVVPDEALLAEAGKIIREGGLVVFPTETVYGIGANFLDEKAVERIYQIKNRPSNKPLTVHISNMDMVKHMGCSVTDFARLLIEKYWPGPLTIILKSDSGQTIGFRMPRHNVALGLIEHSGVPVVAPSANISGEIPPVDAILAMHYLGGKVDMALDAGPTELRIESTVLDLSNLPYRVLREGAISKSQIADVGFALRA